MRGGILFCRKERGCWMVVIHPARPLLILPNWAEKLRKLVNGRTVLPLVININSYCGILFFFLKFVKFEKKNHRIINFGCHCFFYLGKYEYYDCNINASKDLKKKKEEVKQ